MQIIIIEVLDESVERCFQFICRLPFPQPAQFFFESAHHPLGIGVSLSIVVSGKRLLDAQSRTGFYKRTTRRLRAVIAHQVQLGFHFTNASGKLPVNRFI
jgi:hypothetical protein